MNKSWQRAVSRWPGGPQGPPRASPLPVGAPRCGSWVGCQGFCPRLGCSYRIPVHDLLGRSLPFPEPLPPPKIASITCLSGLEPEPRTSSLELTAIYPFKEKKESEAAQSCPTLLTLCNPVDCSPSGSSVRGILQAGMLEGVSHFLLQGISPTRGLNPGLPHCRQTLYRLSHQGSPRGI